MKLIILLIITATLNIILLNKTNILVDNNNSTMAVENANNHAIQLMQKKTKYVDTLKNNLIKRMASFKKQIIQLLIKTNIISIIETKPTQNITLKPQSNDLKSKLNETITDQQI